MSLETGSFLASIRASHIVVSILLACISYYIAYLFYKVYFHPLARYPGPKFRAASWIGFYWYQFLGIEHKSIRSLHDKHGDVVRVAPNMLSFTSSSAWRDIYTSIPGKGQLPREPAFYRLNDTEQPQSIFNASDREHVRVRKALREQEPMLNSWFAFLIERLKDSISSPSEGVVDIAKYFNFTTFDIIGDLGFAESFQCLEKMETHFWIALIFNSLRSFAISRVFLQFPWIGMAGKALLGFFPRLAEARRQHIAFSRERVLRRLEQHDEGRRDFISYLRRYGHWGNQNEWANKTEAGTGPSSCNNEKDDRRTMSVDEICGNMVTLVIAGSETTATMLSGCIYHLLRTPTVLAKLQAEVRAAFGAEEEMTVQLTAAKLPYLSMVISESLRMYPPVPTLLPHVTHVGGNTIGGHTVPKHTVVGVHQWAATHSACNFADPDIFAPERWAADPPAKYAGDDLAASQAFSVGPRACLGRALAFAEMRSILARLVWHFDLELCENSRNWADDNKVFILWDKPPLNVKLSLRKDL